MTDGARPIEKLKGFLANAPDPVSLTLDEQRRATERLVLSNPPADDISYVKTETENYAGAWIETPQSLSERVILYVHGGAFVAGSSHTHRSLIGELARYACARVFAVDYRLAPEAPFPAGLDDCIAAYKDISAMPGVRDLAIAGDSAGGALVLSTLMAARDNGLRMADAVVFFSPWINLTCTADSFDALGEDDPSLSRAFLQKMAGLYLGNTDPKVSAVSPVLGALDKMPPMLIQVSDCEVLLGDSVLLEQRATEARVKASLEIWPDMVHVWHGFTTFLPESHKALQRAGDYLNLTWEDKH